MDGHPSRLDVGAAAAVDGDRGGHHSPWYADAAHSMPRIMRLLSVMHAQGVLAVKQVHKQHSCQSVVQSGLPALQGRSRNRA